MTNPKITGAQREFFAGEIDVALKRSDDHPARKSGLRQMANARILNSGVSQNRPGRAALFPISNNASRIDEFTIQPGVNYKIAFAANRLQVINAAGSIVLNQTTQGNGASLPWASTSDIRSIRFAIFGLSIYICFAGMRPQVLTFDGVSVWSIADYTESISGSGQKRTPFFRLSPQNITMLPSATTGQITVTFSSPVAVAGWVGMRARYAGRQILFTKFNSSTSMNATVIEPLPISQTLTVTAAQGSLAVGDVMLGQTSNATGVVTSAPNSQQIIVNSVTNWNVGDRLTGNTSGATGTIVAFNGLTVAIQLATGTAFTPENITDNTTSVVHTASQAGTVSLIVQLIANSAGFAPQFLASETIVSTTYSAKTTAQAPGTPQAISVWDDEVINSFRGFPLSCFVDQFRLGFCNIPALPNSVAYSAINSPTDIYGQTAQPSGSIFVLTPDKVQIFDIVAGQESNEFVFCDKKIYYIPINPSTPLTPSTIGFQIISGDGAANVQPKLAQELIFYVSSGGNTVMAIIAPGMTQRPFNTRNVTQFHTHLFNNIQLLAPQTADSTFTERYLYVLNANGSIAVGRYMPRQIENDSIVGWGPWSGGGTVTWISANGADIVFTTSYFGVPICEILDDTKYLDAALFVNALPAAFTPPGGKGPLWWIPSQTVSLIDQVNRSMGTYNIDANGNIIPQGNAGENLALASLVAGQPWTATWEMFTPDADPGRSVNQRMFKRRVSRVAAYVSQSTGFVFQRLFSGPLTRTGPALGSLINIRRIDTWNQDDDPTKPPPLREEAQRWRPAGRSFDPRIAVVKDTPGSLVIHEIGMEATV